MEQVKANSSEPGGESFKLCFSRDYFCQKAVLRTSLRKNIATMFRRFLGAIGIYTNYQCQVLGDPKQAGDGYTYNLTVLTKSYYVFFLKVYTVQNPHQYVAGIDPVRNNSDNAEVTIYKYKNGRKL